MKRPLYKVKTRWGTIVALGYRDALRIQYWWGGKIIGKRKGRP